MNRHEVYLAIVVSILSAFMFLAAAFPHPPILQPVNLGLGKVVALEPMATPAPPDPPGKCFEWKTAGIQMIYKCVDEDEGIVCYQPVGGVLQCLVRN